ncbi:hypothetical protein DPMN_189928 [Dreissena polymorpha]|uniref:Uncharacterized protein n=1 Tax=Dreissena polymorpha TaxID=45954 RepID=A0A9D4DUF5_DREPO|nr:hypothetical protein DPMN_189928 [Dreissena polymorpha]
MYDIYYRFIRTSIFEWKNMIHNKFFTQYYGKPFQKVCDGIVQAAANSRQERLEKQS